MLSDYSVVPLGGREERFKKEWPINVAPGPGCYSNSSLSKTTGDLSFSGMSTKRSMPDPAYRSKVPKIIIYANIERDQRRDA